MTEVRAAADRPWVITIRKAAAGDCARVVALYDHYSGRRYAKPDAARQGELLAEIDARGYVALAELDGEAVGSYSMYFCANLAKSGRPFAVVENVIVATAWRRQGVGRALMAHAIAAAREAGCYKLMLATGQESVRNRQFYEACGFSGDKVGFQVRYDD